MDPATLNAVAPKTPPRAMEQGISGEVRVRITLDDQSHLTSALILKSPSPLLNEAAIEAARASTFQTRTHNCVPVGGAFLFIVVFSKTPTDLANYFLGRWSCIENDGHASSMLYAIDGGYLQELHAGQRTTFQQVGDQVWLSSYAPELRYAATSRGNIADGQVVFSGRSLNTKPGDTAITIAVTYDRTDAKHFVRKVESGGNPDALSVQATEHCTRD